MDERRRILVAYESRHGSTREISERIAQGLRVYGLWEVELRLAELVADVAPYQAVIVGSPVYDGRWLPETDGFVREHLRELAERPLWLFSVASFGDTQPLIGELVRKEPRGIDTLLAALNPRSYRVFAGVIDPALWPWYGRLFFHLFGGQLGDNRDWREIDRWIELVASELRVLVPVPTLV